MPSFLETSRLYQYTATGSSRLASFVRGSYLYQWLTAEPDPEVVVIDLRKTWTVGPIIALLDRVVEFAERATAGSALVAAFERLYGETRVAPLRMAGRGLFGTAVVMSVVGILSRSIVGLAVAVVCLLAGAVAIQDDRSWAQLKETQVCALVVAAFEPPAPTEEGEHDGEADDDGESAQPDIDESEANTLNEPHQGVDLDVVDESTGGEVNDRG